MITSDYHVHSDFSGDSQAPMEQMIEKAISLGMERLCFTDHMDYDYPPVTDTCFEFDPAKYFQEINRLKERYRGRIELLAGIELGLQPQVKEQVSGLKKEYSFDFVIGSSHVVDYEDPYYPQFWGHHTRKDGIRRYFETIRDNCRLFQDDFNVYGHLDYIIRYAPATDRTNAPGKITAPSGAITPNGALTPDEAIAPDGAKADYNYADYSDLLDEVLRTILSCGKGIELNTAGLKYGIGYAHPKPEVLKRYRELGGEIITVGSDAHRPEHLCYDFPLVPEILKQAGFRYYTVFIQGKPVFKKL